MKNLGNWLTERAKRISEWALEQELEVRIRQDQEQPLWGTSEWWLYDFFGMDRESAKYTLWALAALMVFLLGALVIGTLT
jgi:hypothetical protein